MPVTVRVVCSCWVHVPVPVHRGVNVSLYAKNDVNFTERCPNCAKMPVAFANPVDSLHFMLFIFTPFHSCSLSLSVPYTVCCAMYTYMNFFSVHKQRYTEHPWHNDFDRSVSWVHCMYVTNFVRH